MVQANYTLDTFEQVLGLQYLSVRFRNTAVQKLGTDDCIYKLRDFDLMKRRDPCDGDGERSMSDRELSDDIVLKAPDSWRRRNLKHSRQQLRKLGLHAAFV